MLDIRRPKAEWLESDFDKKHPFPRFAGIVTPRYALIYLVAVKYKTGVALSACRPVVVWYKKFSTESKLPLAYQKRMCLAKLKSIHEQYGIGSLGNDERSVYQLDALKPRLQEAMLELEERIVRLMYYCELDGQMEGFKTARLRGMMLRIAKASRKKLRVQIRYLKKSTRRLVTRDCAAYSYENGYLYVTDTRSGNTKIRSYIVDRIKAVKVTKHHFRDEYLLEL